MFQVPDLGVVAFISLHGRLPKGAGQQALEPASDGGLAAAFAVIADAVEAVVYISVRCLRGSSHKPSLRAGHKLGAHI